MAKKRHYYKGKRVSKGEKEIINFLVSQRIYFEKEKTFNDCLSPKQHRLRFDFYIPGKNVLIEFDGQHHFKPVNKHRRAQIVHKKTVIHDSIKNKYARYNDIALIRIPYTQIDDVPIILSTHLL